MRYRENRAVYDGPAYSRLWEKSAIGIVADGPGLLLSDSEVIFCRNHRGIEFDGLEDDLEFSSWLTQRLEQNSNLLLEAAVLEALRVPGNKVVLSENFDRLNLGMSHSWAMRWASDSHPKKGAPEAEILWFESKDLLDGNIENDERISNVIDISLKLEGVHRHASTHAAGVVIGDTNISSIVPLYKN